MVKFLGFRSVMMWINLKRQRKMSRKTHPKFRVETRRPRRRLYLGISKINFVLMDAK